MRSVVFIGAALLVVLLSSTSVVADDAQIAAQILAAMNQSVDPCQDFYEYACGSWIAANPLPPSEPAIFKAITDISNRVAASLTQIFNSSAVDPRIKRFYDACMDVDAIEKAGVAPLYSLRPAGWEPFAVPLSSQNVLTIVGAMHTLGVYPLFTPSVSIDPENVTRNVANFAQGGTVLPDRSFYFNDTDLLNAYLETITDAFVALGKSKSAAATAAKAVLALEIRLANASLPDDALLNPFSTYHLLNLGGLQAITPSMHWANYMYGIKLATPAVDEFTLINVEEPTYFQNLDQIFAETSMSTWSAYLTWFQLSTFMPSMSSEFQNIWFSFFGQVLNGEEAPLPRNQTCIAAATTAMPSLVGYEFAQQAFGPSAKAYALAMLETIEGQMKLELQTLTWLDNTTRALALQKLSQVINQIGYPALPDTYSTLEINDNFLQNVAAANTYSFVSFFVTVGGPSNRLLWEMPACEVNAYYDPTINGMVFPAGILQPPYFDPAAPYVLNHAGSGMIMGHELSHGFDDSGSLYTGNGTLFDWWLPATRATFNHLVSCVIEQYDNYEILPGLFIDGNMTSTENLADNGGLMLSYKSWAAVAGDNVTAPSIVPGFTNQQLYFLGYAQGWCANEAPSFLRLMAATDPHSPARYRVIGPISNSPVFAEAFSCAANTPMNPPNKCKVW